MPMLASSIRHALLAVSAFALTIGAGDRALAFSIIDPGGGTSESREGIIAVPLPPLPTGDSPDRQAPTGTPPAAPLRNDIAPAVDAPDAGSADTAEPEGTDSEEVPISPEDEDILRERRQPGRGDTIEDSTPLRPDGNSENPPTRSQESQGNGTARSPTARPSGAGVAGQQPSGGRPIEPGAAVHMPGAVKPLTATGSGAAPASAESAGEPPSQAITDEAGRGDADAPAVPLPSQIAYGDDGLPGPVRDLRARLMDIARTGDIEKLRPYLQGGEDATVLSFGDTPNDPIAFLKDASGDGQGVEMLAILLEVLQAGHAHVEPGDADEIYVWPYFTQLRIDTLTGPQMVQLFELVTAGDHEAMKAFGAYNFFRVGISPDGKLEFFVAGD